MDQEKIPTDVPKVGAEAQPIEGGVVSLQTKNNSTEQENGAQANTGASPVGNGDSKKADSEIGSDNTEPINDVEDPSEASTGDIPTGAKPKEAIDKKVDCKDKASSKGLTRLKNVPEAPVKKDYTPIYVGAEKEKLETITKVCEEEIARVILDPRYSSVPYASGTNCLIDLRKAHLEGKIQFVKPVVNRIHGGDQKKTGESMLTYGPQHILLVMTVKMAQAAGILPTRFANDKSTDPIPDDTLVMMDGNGRMDFLMGLEPEDWPEIYAVFPSKDAAGYYNLNMAFDVINTQVSVWKTQDMVQKRIIIDGSSSHPGFKFINTLVQKGYKYQSACQLATLETDRIKKGEVTSGDAKTIFIYHDSAVRVYEALKTKVGEEPLKTKGVTQEVSILWKKLNKNYNAEEATNFFVDFINQLSDEKVKAIKDAKNIKGGANKDEQRKKVLEENFIFYAGSKGLKID